MEAIKFFSETGGSSLYFNCSFGGAFVERGR